jgi:ABC-type antimicrobial peptide transport system permease subunit
MLFGCLAIALASIGLYGLLSYEVTRRTRELGIRSALGAQQREMLRMIVGQGFVLALLGGIVGVGMALGLTRFVRSQLYGVAPNDPLTYSAVVLLILVVAVLACAIPARRATKVDPVVALRYE